MASLGSVSQLLAQSLDFKESKVAEQQLRQLELSPHFPSVLLQVVGDSNIPLDTRLAGALFFKNLVKRKWNDSDGNYLLAANDVTTIKSNIIELMTQVPAQPRKQLGEAISIIADSDFPDRWPTLVPELVARLDPATPEINNAVLSVAHAIFERWRALSRSDALFLEIKLVLDQFANPYLAFMAETDRRLKHSPSTPWYESMDLLVKLFYDLNCQDLPEFFEDHLSEFMGLLLEYLTFSPPPGSFQDENDDDAAGVIGDLRTAVCEALTLYTERYEEEFSPFMPKFVEAGWTLLTSIGPQPKYDLLVNRCLSFLTAVAKFERNIHMFSSEGTLVQIIERIVIPNMRIRESDIEVFEDEPIDFVRRDLEGSQNDTRGQAATVFLRELAAKMEGEVTKVVMHYVDEFLNLYRQDPNSNWLGKSTASSLFSAIAAKGQITSAGVSTTNLLIDVVAFFNTNMAPELAVGNHHPLLKVDAIRFILSFRNQLTKVQLSEALPLLVSLLNRNEHPAVYTYAAITLERILAVRDPVSKQPMFGERDISGHVRELSTHTLQLVANGASRSEELAANEFLMRLLMRVLLISGGEARAVAPVIVPQLVQIIQVVSSNPSNPRFNHYLFESLGACLKYYTDFPQVDKIVVQPLFGILGADVTEFVPYVMQILTEILVLQPPELGLPESYQQLLKPVLSPSLWEARGNVPALVGLLEAIVSRGPSLVLEQGLLVPLLGVFQNLLSSRARDHHAFDLLSTIMVSIPTSNLAPYIGQIAKLLLARLEKGNTDKYAANLTRFVYFIAASQSPLGPELSIQLFDSAQPQSFGTLFISVMVPKTLQINGAINRRVAAVGLTRLLCGTPQFVSGEYASHWRPGIDVLIVLLTRDIAESTGDPVVDVDLSELSFGSSFSPLATTRMKPTDPVAYIGLTPQQYFSQEFKKVSQDSTIQQQVSLLGEKETQYLRLALS